MGRFSKFLLFGLLLIAGAAVGQMSTTNYSEQGAERWVIGGSLDVASGGDLDIESGGALAIAGTNVTSTAAELNALDGVTSTFQQLNGTFRVVSLASGALTVNTVHLATASAADYDIPSTFCDAAGDVGNWVTVIVEDASSTISITVDDVSNVIIVPQLSLGADDELDSVSDAGGEGTHITLVCMAVDGIYATSMSDIAGVIAWADGGAAD